MICNVLPGSSGGAIGILGIEGAGGILRKGGGMGGGGGILAIDGGKGGGIGTFPDGSAADDEDPKISGYWLLMLFAVSVSAYRENNFAIASAPRFSLLWLQPSPVLSSISLSYVPNVRFVLSSN